MKKLMIGMLVIAVSMFSLQNSAQATLISQDIYFMDSTSTDSLLVGNISIDLGTLDDSNETTTWQSFTLNGFDFDATVLANIFDFLVIIDPTDLAAGIQLFNYDVSDDAGFVYAGGYEAGFYGEFTINDPAGMLISDGDLELDAATVVPEPAALLLMLVGFGGLAMRRRKFK